MGRSEPDSQKGAGMGFLGLNEGEWRRKEEGGRRKEEKKTRRCVDHSTRDDPYATLPFISSYLPCQCTIFLTTLIFL